MYTQAAEEAIRRIRQADKDTGELRAQNARLHERIEQYREDVLAAAQKHAGLIQAGGVGKKRFLEAFAREVEIRRSILAIVKDQAPNLAEKLQLSLTRLESTPERMEQASLADHMQAKRPAGQGDAEAPFASSDAQISIEAKAFRSLVKELSRKRAEFDSRLARHLPNPCKELKTLVVQLSAQSKATENLAAENAAIFSQLRRLVRALEDTTESLHHERGLRRDAMTALQREKTKAEGLSLRLALSRNKTPAAAGMGSRMTGIVRHSASGPLTPPALADESTDDDVEEDNRSSTGPHRQSRDQHHDPAHIAIESSDEEPNPRLIPESDSEEDDNEEVYHDVQALTGQRWTDAKEAYRSELIDEVRNTLSRSIS